MTLNFCRHQVMEKLGIESEPLAPLGLEGPVLLVYSKACLLPRSQQFPMPIVEGEEMRISEVDDEPIRPDGPMFDMTVPARKCPTCEANGTTTWVMPGKECPRCNSVVDQWVMH